MKRIVIVGSGNLAEALARAVARTDSLRRVQIGARTEARARAVAAIAGTSWTCDPQRVAPADLYILAVSDRAVGEAAAALAAPAGAAAVHTAGSVPLDALAPRFARRGVLYPLQTFTQGRPVDFAEIPLFIEASDAAFFAELETLARTLSRTVLPADSSRRALIHLAGVFACNFVNHAYALGEAVVRSAGLDFAILKPLIGETARKALDAASPADVQTGPAVRHDAPTLERHERLLSGDEQLQTLYTAISRHIWETSKKR